MLPIAEVLVVEADVRLGSHHPAALFDDRTLERCLLPGVPYDLLEIVVVEDAAHHVLGARLLTALEERHLEAGLCHRDGRGGACGPRADDHGVELLLVSHPTQS